MRRDPSLLTDMVDNIGRVLRAGGHMLASAESCTGGLISSILTDVPGSSDWFLGGVVAYSNQIKRKLLGVPENILAESGAVSLETVRAMALGVNRLFETQVSIAVSGIAGPSGGSPEKPVGTVCMAWSLYGGVMAEKFLFSGTRMEIKFQTAAQCLEILLDLLGQPKGGPGS